MGDILIRYYLSLAVVEAWLFQDDTHGCDALLPLIRGIGMTPIQPPNCPRGRRPTNRQTVIREWAVSMGTILK